MRYNSATIQWLASIAFNVDNYMRLDRPDKAARQDCAWFAICYFDELGFVI